MDLIYNFNYFWDSRYLFKADRICLTQRGVSPFSSNLLYSLHHPLVPTAKNSKQVEPLSDEISKQHGSYIQPISANNIQLHQENPPLPHANKQQEEVLSPPLTPESYKEPCEEPLMDSATPKRRWGEVSTALHFCIHLASPVPLLKFTDHMEDLASAGTRLTPCPTTPSPSPQIAQTEVLTKRYITENTSDHFIHAFSHSPALPWTSINELLDYLNFKLQTLLMPFPPPQWRLSLVSKNLHGEIMSQSKTFMLYLRLSCVEKDMIDMAH